MSDFKENLSVFTKENIETTKWKWKLVRISQILITASKSHEVVTKMTEVERGGGGTVNMRSLNQKISELVFVKPNTPALKFGGYIEKEAANNFIEFIKGKHTDIKLSHCGRFVDEK